MDRIKKILLSLFISPEFILSILLVIIFLITKVPFNFIGHKVVSNKLLFFTPIVPWALLFYMFNNANQILRPNNRSKNILMEWDNYQSYKDTTYIGVFYIIIGGLITLAMVLIESEINNSILGLFLVISYLISIISFMTMFFAMNKIGEILEKNI